ncbi:PfkB family carbohydrate kinase [Roseateles sp. BYS87W]|uniref:PfkB family carbohydrate kinase n=1 Tax=Pelomonas baiyunensis TaxID=3299026 RepID=A0ABW7GWQ8_9BURK
MPAVLHADLPRFVAFGEALTQLTRVGPDLWRSSCAGAPWRVAVALSSLGQLSAFAGAVSQEPFGTALWQASQDANLDLRFLQQLPRAPLLAVLHSVQPPHWELIGDDSADLHFRPEGLPQGWTRALRWAHFGSLGLVRRPLAGRLIALAQALKGEGRLISYDPGYRGLPMDSNYDETLELMCRMADLVRLSEADLRGLFRVGDVRSGLAQMAAWNPTGWLLLTRADGSATLYHGVQECHGQPPPHALGDTADMGDAVLAGLLDSLMRDAGAPAAQHLRWALAAGAAACSVTGWVPPRAAVADGLASSVRMTPD